nr:AAA family ATPase [uncultured Roseovarius sp.]
MMTADKPNRPATFNDMVCRLIDNGYLPVPIPAGCKGPTITGWQHLHMTKEQVPEYFNQPDMLVGVLHKNTCFLDIDVYDAELSETIAEEARRIFPGALERVGQYPKTAIVLALDEVGFKVANTVRGQAEIDGKIITAQVEVRTLTRQAVVYGKHPDTGEYYKWVNGPDLWETPISELPIAKKEDVQAFRDWADQKIREWSDDAAPQNQTAEIFNIGVFHPSCQSDDRATEEQFLEALKHASPHSDYDTWLQCLMAIHDFYGGSAKGLEVAQNWSSDYHSYNAHEVETKWRSFEVGKGVSYRTAFALAKQNGADLSAIARLGRKDTAAESLAASFTIATQPTQNATNAEPEAAPQPASDWPTVYDDFDETSIEPRQWIYANHYLRSFVSVLASAGGIGKTSLQIVEALAICTGKPLLGEQVKQQCNVWIVNLEDPMDEMKRRVLAAMRHYGITPDEVRGRLFVDAGREFSLIFAAQTREGVIPNDALVAHLKQKIPERDIGCVFIDPFVGAHQINENDNMAVNSVVAQIREVADETRCAIGLVHHIRKGNGQDADIDSVRGAGSLIGAARAARVINRVSEKDAIELGVKPEDAIGIFRVDDGKANLAPPAANAVYRRMSGVQIANGEWVGVAVPFELPDEWSGLTTEVINTILGQISAGLQNTDSEEFFSLRPQDKARWVGQLIVDYPFSRAEDFKTEGQAKQIIKAWLASGLIEEITYHSASQRKDRKGVVATGRVGEQL